VADIYNAQIRGTEAFGGEYTSIVPMLPTGVGTTTPHLTWNSEPFQYGEATILELAGCRMRYHCPMSRTVHLGPPPKRMAEIAEVAVEALNVAVESMRPGVTCEEVHAAWNRVVSRHGIVKDSRMGYSIGLNYPPDWGEHTLSIRPGDTTSLQAGMTIHVMPGIWLDNWGIEISEGVLVTETGAERLCDFPQGLVIKD
jgi:Xaa-Pro aminopeptidase